METRERKLKEKGVMVEAADTLCGKIPHMTVDQLAARLNIESRELRCPSCGRIHLNAEDASKAEETLYRDSQRFKEIEKQAEGEEE